MCFLLNLRAVLSPATSVIGHFMKTDLLWWWWWFSIFYLKTWFTIYLAFRFRPLPHILFLRYLLVYLYMILVITLFAGRIINRKIVPSVRFQNVQNNLLSILYSVIFSIDTCISFDDGIPHNVWLLIVFVLWSADPFQ